MRMTEHEIMLTGIGGQGVQIAATVLSSAAIREGMEALQLATYTGAMRGGQSMVTLVLSDGPILSPPVLTSAWAGVVLHTYFAEEAVSKIRPDGIALINSRLVKPDVVRHVHNVVAIDAVQIAADAGSPTSVSMVMVAAFARASGLVGVDSLVEAMVHALPAYRRDRAAGNEAAIRAGFEAAADFDFGRREMRV
jgi:Pyruvate/2-oxoacid:ferredoxin oxidoreductase gamma subunit